MEQQQLVQSDTIENFCYTVNACRNHHSPYRLSIVADSWLHLYSQLKNLELTTKKKTALAFVLNSDSDNGLIKRQSKNMKLLREWGIKPSVIVCWNESKHCFESLCEAVSHNKALTPFFKRATRDKTNIIKSFAPEQFRLVNLMKSIGSTKGLKQLLQIVAEEYVQGAELNWNTIYSTPYLGRHQRDITVPTYAFQRKSYWFTDIAPPSNSVDNDTTDIATVRPFIDKVSWRKSDDSKRNELHCGLYLNPEIPSPWNDHSFSGVGVFPISAWFEVLAEICDVMSARAAHPAARTTTNGVFRISDLEIPGTACTKVGASTQLRLIAAQTPEGSTTIDAHLERKGASSFECGDSKPVMRATAQLLQENSHLSCNSTEDIIDPSRVSEVMQSWKQIDLSAQREFLKNYCEIVYGSYLPGPSKLFVNSDQDACFATIQLGIDHDRALSWTIGHPSIIDAAIQSLHPLLFVSEDRFYLAHKCKQSEFRTAPAVFNNKLYVTSRILKQHPATSETCRVVEVKTWDAETRQCIMFVILECHLFTAASLKTNITSATMLFQEREIPPRVISSKAESESIVKSFLQGLCSAEISEEVWFRNLNSVDKTNVESRFYQATGIWTSVNTCQSIDDLATQLYENSKKLQSSTTSTTSTNSSQSELQRVLVQLNDVHPVNADRIQIFFAGGAQTLDPWIKFINKNSSLVSDGKRKSSLLGFKVPDLFSKTKCWQDLPSLAAICVAAVEDITTRATDEVKKAITLYGFSFGGFVAYEVANQLKQKGFDIEKVFLLDPKKNVGAPPDADSILSDSNQFLGSSNKELVSSEITNDWQVISSYKPVSLSNIKVTLIVPEMEHSGFAGWPPTEEWWKALLPPSNISVHPLPGHHFEMLSMPELAPLLFADK